jgi:HEAT repeat protein
MTKEGKIAGMKQKGDRNGLVEIIKNDDEWRSRMDAAEALAQLGDKRGLNYLINALNDTDTEIRDAAREILEGLDDPRGNQALRQPRKLDSIHSAPDNNSTSHAIDNEINKKAARSRTKRKQRNHESYSRTVLIIIAIAGILIFIDSFSWSKGGMNGLMSLLVGMIAVVALILVTLASAAGNIAQTIKETTSQREYDTRNTSGAQTNSQKHKAISQSQKSYHYYLPIFVLIFGSLGTLTGYYLAIRDNSGANVNWENAGHPENVRIIKVIASDTDLVRVKTEDGVIHTTNLDACRDINHNGVANDDCWHIDVSDMKFMNEWVINDQACRGKSKPPKPPVARASDEMVIRNCPYGITREMRMFVSDDGNLWFWHHGMTQTPPKIGLAFVLGLIGMIIGGITSRAYAQKKQDQEMDSNTRQNVDGVVKE